MVEYSSPKGKILVRFQSWVQLKTKTMNKYIVINSEDIQKRIEELKKLLIEFDNLPRNERSNDSDRLIIEYETEQAILKSILAKSKPLTPIIEDAFEAGMIHGVEEYEQVDETTAMNKQDYINNLKLDI